MLEKTEITEEDYECLAKGIATGVGIGVLIGVFTGNIIFTFALGGVIGILMSLGCSFFRKYKKGSKKII
ncbi:hypothetical protein KPL42_17815 [Clostridium gasigenes]|uniref:hypothetical protein n=1 Tax=Clostridium gasigenes TaxID=94869 RepID=UPI0014386912|nr:hypothetical protein [Clostridium gasigenes]MBU3090327.1 hypothetical protein [Clostridium gasigenes]MBU3109871.1 hypothetical protein [Clostridium gasigenes]NKF08803.1 hypothetical protein [Clostridium gasigenes]QSW20875.1 hypothetical protein J1C67_07150 [Clostridium gasigenes]